MKEKINNLLKLFAMNKAVLWGVIARGWTAIAGVITVFLVVFFFSPVLQGYYFTFHSLLALQIFVELGLCNVILHFASHEWAKLSFDEKGNIKGDKDALSRLRSLAKVSFLWYFFGGLILFVGLSSVGYLFFVRSAQNGINWVYPWLALCALTGINMWLLPSFSLLEGSNQMAQVNRYRFIQGVIRSVSTWIIISLGGKLWATAGAVFIPLFWTAYFLWKKYFNYFKDLSRRISGPRLDWQKDVWPMQWRLAVSWLSNYFSFYIFTPVLFFFKGPVVAGQMGMTWSIVNALSLISVVWIFARAPEYGILIAKKQYDKLDKLFYRSSAAAIGVSMFGSVIIFIFVSILYAIGHPFSVRFLPPLPTGFLLIATVFMQVFYAEGTYLRAHKKEPFMLLSLITAIIIAVFVVITGWLWGALGVTFVYMLVVVFIIFPSGTIIWYRHRRDRGISDEGVFDDEGGYIS